MRPTKLARPVLALALVAGVALVPSTPIAAGAASVPSPTVYGPIQGGLHGYPWNHSLFKLNTRNYHYTEREYFFSGTATDLSTGAQAPYESRMLVRLPQHASDFSGIVTVEWLNVTAQSDYETSWPTTGKYLMRHGIGFVGVSAQMAGVCCGPTTLQGWDPKRYAALQHPGDQFSYDIFSQAIKALRAPKHNGTTSLYPTPVDPMRGMKAKWIVANGASQSASRLTSFVNGGYNRGQIDLYVITRGGGPYTDFSTPIFQLNEENNAAPQKNNKRYVAWEEAGTAHAPAAWWGYISREQQRDEFPPGQPDAINTACSVNHGSVDFSARALSRWVGAFLRHGTLPPAPPRVKRDSSGSIVRDKNGLAEGGIRHVFVQVPVGFNTSAGCPLYGTYTPWSAAQIKSLYATHAAYMRDIRTWTAKEVARGWLIRPDRALVLRKARAFRAPWTGRCTDSCPAPLGL